MHNIGFGSTCLTDTDLAENSSIGADTQIWVLKRRIPIYYPTSIIV